MNGKDKTSKIDYIQKPWVTLTGVIAVLVIIAAVYCVWHTIKTGSVNERLSDTDKSVVTFILTDTSANLTSRIKVEKAIQYLFEEIPPADSLIFRKIKNEYSALTINGFLNALPSVTIETSSYFWLNGDMKYLEVIFWSVFGVLASLLYMASETMRKGEFKAAELPVYWAKLFYAPLITLVIVLSFNIITSASQAKIESTSIEIIIFSFVLGFFSGRAIELLNKIKDVILPGKSTTQEESAGRLMLAGTVDIPEEIKNLKPGFDKSKMKVVLIPADDRGHPLEKETDKDGAFYFTPAKEGLYDVEVTKKINDKLYSASIKNKKITKEKPVELTSLLLQKERDDNEQR